MIKLLLKNSFYFLIVQIVSRGISFFLIPLYTAYLSTNDYGVLEIFNVITIIIFAAGSLQIQQGIARFLPDQTFNTSPESKNILISTGFWFNSIAFTFICAIAFLFHKILNQWLVGDAVYLTAFKLSIISIWIGGISSYMQMLKVWQMDGQKSAIANILAVIVTIPLTVLLVLKFKLGIVGIIIATIAGQIITLFFLIKHSFKEIYFRFSSAILRRTLLFSAPLVLSSLAYYSWNFIDRIMLKNYLSLDELGVFSLGIKFAMPFSMLLVILETALFPIIINQYHKKQTANKIKLLFSVVLFFMFVIWLLVILFAKEIITVMANYNFNEAWKIVGLSCGTQLLLGIYFFAPGIAISKKTYWSIASVGAGSIINFCLNFFMIPTFGILGASISTFISALLYIIVLFYLNNKLYKIDYHFIRILSALIILLSLIVVVHWSNISGLNFYILLYFKVFFLITITLFLYKLLINSTVKRLIKRLLIKTYKKNISVS